MKTAKTTNYNNIILSQLRNLRLTNQFSFLEWIIKCTNLKMNAEKLRVVKESNKPA